jgi:hypothetical protein
MCNDKSKKKKKRKKEKKIRVRTAKYRAEPNRKLIPAAAFVRVQETITRVVISRCGWSQLGNAVVTPGPD